MIVVDTSVLYALSQHEADADIWVEHLKVAERLGLPASCYLEYCIVTNRRNVGRAWLDRWVEYLAVDILPISAATARLAADAFERYGKGNGHPAQLNFGDCLSYAVAKESDAALLFKGADFSHTDIRCAA